MMPYNRTISQFPGRFWIKRLSLICILLFIYTSAFAEEGILAHWSFDDLKEDTFVNNVCTENPAKIQRGRENIQLTEGVYSKAVYFSGNHLLATASSNWDTIETITILAWVKPERFSQYNEIFRKENTDSRILFSFQDHGKILSLGLNIGGYVECDARMYPEYMSNGDWHLAAGVYDGEFMRLYLDGRQIYRMKRPGRIRMGGPAVGCIGSIQGNETFQGTMDELKIYNRTLTSEQIKQVYEQARESLDQDYQRRMKLLEQVYQKKDAFVTSLIGTAEAIKKSDMPQIACTAKAALERDFPGEYDSFIINTGVNLFDYLTGEQEFNFGDAAQKSYDLMVEYEPLTKEQWEQQSTEQLAHWQRVGELKEQYHQLQGTNTDDQGWINFILESADYIDLRPVEREAVAPYVKPYTPETRDYTEGQARELLEKDWLFQANNKPTVKQTLQEIAWTRQIAERIQIACSEKIDLTKELQALSQLETKATALPQEQEDTTLYFDVRKIKRQIMFRDPVIDFDSVLFTDVPFPAGNEWHHETRHRLGYMAVPGGRLLTLKGLDPSGHLTKLMPQEPLHGTFWRPDLSFDAKKVLVSFHPANEKTFHLYEINIDGTGQRQITSGIYDDLDPAYLPDGKHIVFISTRGHNYVRCMPPTNSFQLTRCDLNGDNIYMISRNNEPDYLPAVLDDGRVIYTRWEYTDKPLWRIQSLWTVYPDGRQASTLWGNQSVWPDLLKDARQIPGSNRIMFTGSAHHDWFAGSVGIVDPTKGLNFPDGLTKVTAELIWPESGNGPVDPIESPNYHTSGQIWSYYSPHPLSEKVFLVSAYRRKDKFVLYLMDTDGNKELIYEGANQIFHALPIRPRPLPPVIPDQVQWPTMEQRENPASGVIYSNNVYQDAPESLKGLAKYLRILSMDAKTYTYWNKRPYASTGPVVSIVSSEGVKRILGTVPIEKDGSVSFQAPSGKAMYFQLLDENMLALQTMRSISGVMPGETRGCTGCHEMHSTTPHSPAYAVKALTRQPSTITPPPWGDQSVSYDRFVQPTLDTYCGKCHQGDGKAKATLDLTRRPGWLVFPEPYLTLTGFPTWAEPYDKKDNQSCGFGIADTIMVEAFDTRDPKAYVTPEPMQKLSYASRLIKIASSGEHHGVKVDPVSLQKLIAWVDTMCPLRGDEEIRQIPDPEFQGIDWLSIRPQIQNAPVIVRPGPLNTE